MKPKKRQPFDFSATPTETPREETLAAEVKAAEVEAVEPPAVPDFPETTSFAEPEAELPSAEPLTLRDTVGDDLDVPPPSTVRSRRRREPKSEAFKTFAEPDLKPATSLAASAQPPAPIVEPDVPTPAPSRDTSLDLRGPMAEAPTPLVAEKAPRRMSGVLFWTLATAVAALWALAPIAFALGYARGVPAFRVEGFALMVFAGLAIGPALLTLLGAYLLRQANGISDELRRTRTLTDRIVTPAALAAVGASSAVDAMRQGVDEAAAAAERAREHIISLRQALAEETARLAEAAADSAKTANQLAQGLGHERTAMESLSHSLDARSTAVVDAIGSQARMVAEASDLAETQLREAEAALAARAADLAAAAAEASDAARVGAEDLSRQIARLETAGHGVGDQISSVEKSLAAQRAALVEASQALRSEQEDFASEAETRTAQLTEFVAYTRVGATELSDSAAMGAEILRGLIGAAAEQFREMVDGARNQRDGLNDEVKKTLEAIGDVAENQRNLLEDELKAAMEAMAEAALKASEGVEARVEAARSRVDQLNEIAFAAGQKADAVFESRMEEARDIIEHSAQMVEQAGARTSQKLQDSVQSARGTLDELEGMLAEIGKRTADLPAEALQKAAEVRVAIEQGVEQLMNAVRRTAEETAAIDQAFQERVRRNYEMLSEAAGAVTASTNSTMAARAASPIAPPRRAAPTPPPVAFQPPAPQPTQPLPMAEFDDEDEPPADNRRRLRLTPTATDEEFRSVFEQAQTRKQAPPLPSAEPEGEGGWSWRNLLAGIENSSPGDTALGEKLASEITAMGIDPHALLPRGRIDEIAAALQTRDASGAREVVKRLAPAAIRRLVRRLFSDATLKSNTERFLARYAGMIDEAAGQDREGFLLAALLSSDAGRAYLLLDAASGDLR
ncbi:polar localization protein TipN [Caulobacter sp. RHG1]|uniref:polar localization protein TipN n=1 Tax=Caulobacter sp. (strain RHG1) TaxID=2545762 RepID=UPI001553330B|nr:polar localization protein TipN [Caulobacter sp. RHG1]NQE61778.1 Kinesin-like protein [Caulobacter sp. RHG1]